MQRGWLVGLAICLAVVVSARDLSTNLDNQASARSVRLLSSQTLAAPGDYCALASKMKDLPLGRCTSLRGCGWRILGAHEAPSTTDLAAGARSDPLTSYFEGWRAWCAGSREDAVFAWRQHGWLIGERFFQAGKNLLLGDKQPASALAWLQLAVALRSEDAAVWVVLGDAYLQSNDVQEAATAYNRAIELNATQPTAYAGAAVAEFLLGQFDAAQQHIEAAIDQAPNVPVYWQIYGGILLLIRQNAPEAETWFRKVVNAEPANHQARTNLAVALVRQGKVGEAQDVLTKAIELTSSPKQRATYLAAYANELLSIDQPKEAIQYYLLALQSDASNVDDVMSLAATYARLGECDEAKLTVQRFGLANLADSARLRPIDECVPAAR